MSPAGKGLTPLLSCVFVPYGISGQVWYLIASISEFRLYLSLFALILLMKREIEIEIELAGWFVCYNSLGAIVCTVSSDRGIYILIFNTISPTFMKT